MKKLLLILLCLPIIVFSQTQLLDRKNTPLFYIYDDGIVEKRITID